MIVLDTHALLWWVSDPSRLGANARRAITDATQLGVPSIVFWEVALLVRKARVDLGMSIGDWTKTVLAIPRCQPILMTPEIAVRAEALSMHADPADRFIVASTLVHDAHLVTKDGLISEVMGLNVIW